MAMSRTVLLKTGIITDVGTISLIVTACGVIGSLAMFWAARAAGVNFLFERPDRFKLVPDKAKPAPRPVLQPAE
jgi:membrane protein DedA with SNARE-associated domain